jgi:hypothetical protein
MIREFINIVESADGINDAWFETDAFKAYKDSTAREPFEIAQSDGYIDPKDAKESSGKPVPYKEGWYIITGPVGEKYTFPPEKFHELKTDNGDGTATPKPIVKLAKLADHSGVVNTSWGEPLHYNPGEDVIVRHGTNDYGVVKKDIFAKTYKRAD